jgi:hypothetical protein
MERRDFVTAVDSSPRLRQLLLRFTGTFMAQMGRTIVSNLIHPIERRTARGSCSIMTGWMATRSR